MDKINEKWEEILRTVKEEHSISDVSFDTWMRPLEVYAVEDNVVYLLVQLDPMALTYIERRYYRPLKVAIGEITGINYEIKFIVPEEAKNLHLKIKKNGKPSPNVSSANSNLNPNYTFETFVVGNNNRFAQSASLAIAESPSKV